MTRFKLKIGYTDYWFWVIVHDTVEEMRRAADQYDIKSGAVRPIRGAGDETGYFGRALGVTHKYEREIYTKNGLWIEYPNVGVIRLCKPYLSTEIVSHELMHAVAWTWKLKYGHSIGRAYKNGWREEMLCHMYGHSFSLLNRLMYKKGLWK